jgi:hypothetical protein
MRNSAVVKRSRPEHSRTRDFSPPRGVQTGSGVQTSYSNDNLRYFPGLKRPVHEIVQFTLPSSGPGSSVGIATDYGLESRGIESVGSEIFRTCPDRRWSPHSVLYNGYRIFSGVESGRGVTLTSHPLLVPRSKNRVELYLCSP